MSTAISREPGMGNGRTIRDIDADITDELAFHLECLEQMLREQGRPPDTAAQEAQRRFGDAARIARECQHIATKEQRMWKKIAVTLMVVLAVSLTLSVAVGFSAVARARRAAEESRAVAESAQLHAVAAQQEAARQATAARDALAQSQSLIYITGMVARPGPMTLGKAGSRSAIRAVIAAGGANAGAEGVVIVRRGKLSESRSVVATIRIDAPETDVALEANDVVTVK